MPENKAALLIASLNYDDPYFRPLKSPAQDVKALSRVLSDPAIGGFCEVKTLLNEPKEALVFAIEEFFDDRNRDDLLLLYFSGHGIKDEDGRLHYATKNTFHKRLVSTAVPAYLVNDLIGKSRSRRKILVLDCCYSGAFSKTFLAKGDAAVGVMEEFKQGQGLVTLAASDAFQYSFEGEEAGVTGDVCSVFTRALVEGIETGKADEDGDQLISLDELYHYAYERVRSERPQQSPRRAGEIEGDIFVARNPRPPQSVELPPWLRKEIESDYAPSRLSAVHELDRLLHGRNKALALAAYETLIKLKDDDSRKVASAAETCVRAEQQRTGREEVEAERLRREKAEPERFERERAEQGRQTQERAEAERRVAEAEGAARERAEGKMPALAEREAAERAEADRVGREKAEQEKLERERTEQRQQMQEKAECLVAERAEAEHATQQRAEQQTCGNETAERERLAGERTEAEQKPVQPRIPSLMEAYETAHEKDESAKPSFVAQQREEVERREMEAEEAPHKAELECEAPGQTAVCKVEDVTTSVSGADEPPRSASRLVVCSTVLFVGVLGGLAAVASGNLVALTTAFGSWSEISLFYVCGALMGVLVAAMLFLRTLFKAPIGRIGAVLCGASWMIGWAILDHARFDWTPGIFGGTLIVSIGLLANRKRMRRSRLKEHE